MIQVYGSEVQSHGAASGSVLAVAVALGGFCTLTAGLTLFIMVVRVRFVMVLILSVCLCGGDLRTVLCAVLNARFHLATLTGECCYATQSD